MKMKMKMKKAVSLGLTGLVFVSNFSNVPIVFAQEANQVTNSIQEESKEEVENEPIVSSELVTQADGDTASKVEENTEKHSSQENETLETEAPVNEVGKVSSSLESLDSSSTLDKESTVLGGASYFFNDQTQELTLTGGAIRDMADWGGLDKTKIKKVTFQNNVQMSLNSMNSLFADMGELTEINNADYLQGTQNVVSMLGVFYGDSKLKKIEGIEHWKTQNVTSMNGMFMDNTSLTSLDLSLWDTSNVTDMSLLFYNTGLTALNVSGWNTNKTTAMDYMFAESTSLRELNISSFDTSKVTDMLQMFDQVKLYKLTLGSRFKFSSNAALGNPFTNTGSGHAAEKWISEDGKSSTYSPKEFMASYGTGNLTGGTYIAATQLWGGVYFFFNKQTQELTLIGGMIRDMTDWGDLDKTKIKKVTFQNNVQLPNSMDYMFADMGELTEINNADYLQGTQNVTSMLSVFHNDTNLKKIEGIEQWNTQNVTTMQKMFKNTPSLTSLDLSLWDTSNVINMGGLFQNTGLTALNVSGWNTNNTTAMDYMFAESTSLRELNISDFDTSKVTYMYKMFDQVKLQKLALGSLFKFSSDAALGNPFTTTGYEVQKWINEDGKSAAYSPEEFMASYGTGDLMGGNYIAQNAAPTADPRMQIVNIGEELPKDAMEVLENIKDDGPISDLTATYLEVPDTSKIGHYTAQVELKDKVDNKTVIQIPVNVIDDDTDIYKPESENLGSAIHAENFTIHSYELEEVKDISTFILQKSNAVSWKLYTGDAVSLSARSSELKPGAGVGVYTANISFPAGLHAKDIEISVINDAPTADPKMQIVNIGEELPKDAMDVLENIKDDGPISDLTATYLEVPDTSKIGHYSAQVELKDKADNKTVIQIPVNVIDDNTDYNTTGLYPSALYAEDVTMYSDEVQELLDQDDDHFALAQAIASKSNARAWVLSDGLDVTDQIVGEHKNLDVTATPGSYEATIAVADGIQVTNSIKVTVIDSSQQLDVTVPINTEFVSLNTDSGKIKSPKYHLTNNSIKDIEIGVNDVKVKNNSDNITLLPSSTSNPSQGKNAMKLVLEHYNKGKHLKLDLIAGNFVENWLELSPGEGSDFEIGGDYFGYYNKDKELNLDIVYSFKIK